MDTFPMTPSSYTALEEELKLLKGPERQRVIAAISKRGRTGICRKTPNTMRPKSNKATMKAGSRSLRT